MKLHSLCRMGVFLNHISHVHFFVPAECSQFPERPIKLDLDGQFLSLMKLLKGSLAMAVALFRRLLRVPWDFSTCYTPADPPARDADHAPVPPPLPTGCQCVRLQIDMSWVSLTARVFQLLLPLPGPGWTPYTALPRASDYCLALANLCVL